MRRTLTVSDVGSLTVELAVLAPGLVLLLLLVAAAGRLVEAQSCLDGAARDAARAATLGRSGAQADALARQAALVDLGASTWCAGGSVRTRVSGFPQPGPSAVSGGVVSATVSCEVGMSPFTALGFATRMPLTGRAAAPLDPFVCRDGTC